MSKLQGPDLSAYVPRHLLDRDLTSAHPDVGLVDSTLVFIDLSGFTAMSERLARKGKVGAEEVTDVLSDTFSRLLEAAYRSSGSLLKFGGDALLLHFRDQNHASRGVFAAFEMRRTLRELGRIKTSAGMVELRMTVGVHSDLYPLFLVGDSHRELILTGPQVSRAVATEGAAKAGEILISSETAERIDVANIGSRRGENFLLRGRPAEPEGFSDPSLRVQRSKDPRPFIPLELRKHLEEGGGEDAEHRQVTIGFIHFSGTDQLAHTEGVDRLKDRLHHLVCLVQKAAAEHGVCFLGTDVDEDGGKIILTGGAPRSFGNNEERMLRVLDLVMRSDPPLDLAVGVHRGMVFAGSVGPPYRRTYTIMGDAVNTAARVMVHAGHGEVLATELLVEHSTAEVDVEALPAFSAKGKSKPIQVVKIGSIKGRRTATSESLPLVGRQAEMDLLIQMADSARQGHGRVIEIVADAGSGKSRLAEELSDVGGLPVLRIRCEQYESGRAFYSLRPFILHALGLAPSAEADEIASRLEGKIAERCTDIGPWAPLLGIPLGLQMKATPSVEALDPAFRKSRMHEVVGSFLGEVLTDPLIWVIEDAHWMDQASSEFMNHLVRAELPGRPWMIATTRRYEDSGLSLDPQLDVQIMKLQPLATDSAERMVRLVSEGEALSLQTVRLLAERSGGNPLFIQELVNTARRGGIDEIPHDIETVISSRIDRLPPRERSVVRHASVLGKTFPRSLLAEILGGDEHLDSERLSSFIGWDSGHGDFKQSLYQEVAYEGLPFRKRRDLHRRAAESIESDAADPNAAAELLSLHYFRANEPKKAWHYSIIAGEQATVIFANSEAAESFRRALQSVKHIDDLASEDVSKAWENLGMVTELGGMFGDASKAFGSARKLQADPLTQARLAMKQGEMAHRQGVLVQTVRLYRTGLKLLEQVEPSFERERLQVRMLLGLANVYRVRAKTKDSIETAKKAATIAESNHDEAGLAHAHSLLNAVLGEIRSPEAAEYEELPLKIFEKIGDLRQLGWVLNNIGISAQEQGRWEDARHLWLRSAEVREKAGDFVGQAQITTNIAEILSDQGRWQEAIASFEAALQILRPSGQRTVVTWSESTLGYTIGRAGDTKDAVALLEKARQDFEAMKVAYHALIARCRIVEVKLIGGWEEDLDEELLALRKALGSDPAACSWIERMQAAIRFRKGNPEEASKLLDSAVNLAQDAGSPFDLARGLHEAGNLERSLGRDGSALLERAQEIFRTLGVEQVNSLVGP